MSKPDIKAIRERAEKAKYSYDGCYEFHHNSHVDVLALLDHIDKMTKVLKFYAYEGTYKAFPNYKQGGYNDAPITNDEGYKARKVLGIKETTP